MEFEENRRISSAVIKRLPRYYRYLGSLLENGITRISSGELSRRTGLTASQIRQDFNQFGCFGQQGYGYNVDYLYERIKKIIGLTRTYNMVIIGVGNLGRALLHYPKFEKRGYFYTGLFDADPKIVGTTVSGVKVSDISKLDAFLSKNHVDIAVLTLPAECAPVVADILFKHKTSIWNFANFDLKPPRDVFVENVHLMDSVMSLSYKIADRG